MSHIESNTPRQKRSGMSLRSTIPFLILVFVVAVGGTFLALQLFGGSSGEPQLQLVTVEVIITATPDPDAEPQLIVVTATSDRTQVAVPDEVLANVTPITDTGIASSANNAQTDAETTPIVNATALDVLDAAAAETATSLPENCIVHIVESGDTPFGIAEQYGANGFLLLEANGLTEETAISLQIGDVLIVPLEGCAVDQLPGFVASATPDPDAEPADDTTPANTTDEDNGEETEEPDVTPTPDVSPTPTLTPTITLVPTATNAQIEILGVDNTGDVTAEGVRFRNAGNTVNVTGWRLTDADGNEYTFNEQLIFSEAEFTIYTRAGQDTPIALFWGQDTAVWQPGDVITLLDADGNVQATRRVPADGIDLE